jgi:hypothetical protein
MASRAIQYKDTAPARVIRAGHIEAFRLEQIVDRHDTCAANKAVVSIFETSSAGIGNATE